MILAPIVRGRKGEYKKELEKLARQGFVRARIDGVLRSLDEEITLDRRKNHTIEVVVDRLADQAGDREAAGSVGGDGDQARRWPGNGGGGERRGAAVFAEAGVSGLRRERSATGAAVVFLQQPLRRLRNLQRVGEPLELRSGEGDCGPSRPLLDGGIGPGGSSSYMTHNLGYLAAAQFIDLEKPFDKLPEEDAGDSAGGRGREAGNPGDSRQNVQTGDRQRSVSRLVHAVHVAGAVSGLRRQAAETGQPGCARSRRDHRGADRQSRGIGAQNRERLEAVRTRATDRRPGGGRNPQPAGVSGRQWAWNT